MPSTSGYNSSWSPYRSERERTFIMPTFWGMCADLLISSHWAAKKREFQDEHEIFYRLVKMILENVLVIEAENKDEQKLIDELIQACRDYEDWRVGPATAEFVTYRDSRDWARKTELRIRHFGRIQLMPEKLQYLSLTGLPPVKFIGGKITMDALHGDVREWEQYVSYHVAGISASIYECHAPDFSWENCTYKCKHDGETCPYLVGPVYQKTITRMDSALYHYLRNIALRQLVTYKTRVIKPLWDLIASHVQVDEIAAWLQMAKAEGGRPGLEAEGESE